LCIKLAIPVHIHPPRYPKKRAFCDGAAAVRPALDYLDRNHAIVDAVHALIAAPKGSKEERRSGTWATVRYARKDRKPIDLVTPDGRVEP
jgi:hypothetical protein